MPAVIIDTRAIAGTLRQQIQQDATSFTRQYNQTPGLAIIGYAEDRSTIDIMRIVGKQAPEVGIRVVSHLVAGNIKAGEVRRLIEQLNNDPTVHAISLQSPFPKHLDFEEVSSFIAPEKDVEGTNPLNQGKSFMGKTTLVAPPALGVMKILGLYNINPSGRHVVIVGRNLFIGKPLFNLMMKADATVSLCHSVTRNLASHTRQAEILVTCVGKPNLITPEMVRPGAVVLDFGINYLGKSGKVVGDVDFDKVSQVAGAITPMPGGTGPMTIISLYENVLKAARLQQEMAKQTTIVHATPAIEPDSNFSFRNQTPDPEIRANYLPNRTDLVVTPPNTPRNGYFS
jgi:methylenetetrahydrofolate dehydrogenase (NADP+) / methenyltetrahydrofolate cyclohydrolase